MAPAAAGTVPATVAAPVITAPGMAVATTPGTVATSLTGRVPVMAVDTALVMVAPAITAAATGDTSAFQDFILTLAVMVVATSKEC
ncbi:hypothetical protein [Prosthecobacter algae]